MNRKKFEKKYEGLSPFELKNRLIDMAGSLREKVMLNAGRGNPNWVATSSREAFFLFGAFALEDAHRVLSREGLAGAPDSKGIARRFEEFCRIRAEQRGAQFLADAYAYATETLGLNGDNLIGEMVDAF
jgi:aspartate 4-decarboxylase